MSGPSQPPPAPPLSAQQILDGEKRIGLRVYDVTDQTLPTHLRVQRLANYSRLATKYGHPRGITGGMKSNLFKYTGKSGKTPVRPNSDMIAAPDIRARAKVTENYQRSQNWGFTSDELLRLGVFPALDERPFRSNLDNTLYPAFMRSQWLTEKNMPKHKGAIPVLGDDKNGLWLAENQRIWDILLPCLQLASHIWVNQCEDSWLSTLFHGERKPIPQDKNETRLHSQSQLQVRNNLAATTDMTNEMAKYVTLGIKSAHDLSGLPGRSSRRSGLTDPFDLRTEKIMVWLSAEDLQPLLRNDLTLAEITTQRFRVAEILTHEFAHAANYFRNRPENVKEPFFGDEPLAELGYSFENHIFGGAKIRFGSEDDERGGPGLPAGGIGRYDHFTAFSVGYKQTRDPHFPKPVAQGMVDPFWVRDIYPISTSWAADLFKEEFWHTRVPQTANEALRMGPLQYGVRSHLNKSDFKPAAINESTLLDGTESELGPLGMENIVKTGAIGDELVKQNQRAARNVETARIRNVLNSINYPQPGPPTPEEDTFKYFNPLNPESNQKRVGAVHLPLPYVCPAPLYDKIKLWLVENRDPFQLAIDTMYIHEESSFYRYIRDHSDFNRRTGSGRSINLTPHLLREFLYETQRRSELFVWESFPAPGVLRKIAKGWPHRAQPYTFPVTTLSNKLKQAAEDFIDTISFDDFQKIFYTRVGEVRDLDIAEFQFMWNQFSSDDNNILDESWDIPLNEFEEVIRYVAGKDESGHVLTFGPKGIIRFTYDTSSLTGRPEKDDIRNLLVRLRQKEVMFNA